MSDGSVKTFVALWCVFFGSFLCAMDGRTPVLHANNQVRWT
jgi:hypothetical protein